MASPTGANKDKVFLARNTGTNRGAADDSSRLIQVLRGVAVANGLECKISCQNSKVSYVLDTEDVMYRSHSSSSSSSKKPVEGQAADGKTDKWHQWLAKRAAAMAAPVEAAAPTVAPQPEVQVGAA